MAVDSTLPFRRAVIARLKQGTVTNHVDQASIYSSPPADPAWPFVRYGTPSASPFLSSGMDGASIIVAVHGFAKGATDDVAAQIGAAIASDLDGAVLVMDDGQQVQVSWTGSQLLPDGDEANAWHAVVNIRGEAITAPS